MSRIRYVLAACFSNLLKLAPAAAAGALGLLTLGIAWVAVSPSVCSFIASQIPTPVPITDASTLDCLLRHARCVH
jgi:hypothetical protein